MPRTLLLLRHATLWSAPLALPNRAARSPNLADGSLYFTDGVDGDQVQLVSDKSITAMVTPALNGNPADIVITGVGLDGASLTTVVTTSANGDGFVNIGRISAANLNLGVVKVKGNLGWVACLPGPTPIEPSAIFDDVTVHLV